MLRSSALASVGVFNAVHCKQLMDLNMYIRLASQFDMVFIKEKIAQVRIHPYQYRKPVFDSIEGAQQLGVTAERIDAISFLLRSKRGDDKSYRYWLADHLVSLNTHRSDLTRLVTPNLNFMWAERTEVAKYEIKSLIPSGEKFILVDENLWEKGNFEGRPALPFLEHEGHYWGNPSDDYMAIQEVERMIQAGSGYLVFAWPAFWWIDFYSQFYGYLCKNFHNLLNNDRLIVFDLRHDS
jgi:hypothetical protein